MVSWFVFSFDSSHCLGNFMNINTTYELHGNIAMRLEMNSENKFRWLREGRGEY
jgi:hypothetical protein